MSSFLSGLNSGISVYLFGVCQFTWFNIRILLFFFFFRSVENTTSKLDVQSVFSKTVKPAGIKSTLGVAICLDLSASMVSLEKMIIDYLSFSVCLW